MQQNNTQQGFPSPESSPNLSLKAKLGNLFVPVFGVALFLVGPVLLVLAPVLWVNWAQTNTLHQNYLTTLQTETASITSCAPYYNKSNNGGSSESSTFDWVSYQFTYNDHSYTNRIEYLKSKCAVGSTIEIQFVPAEPTLNGPNLKDMLISNEPPTGAIAAIGVGVTFSLWDIMMLRMSRWGKRRSESQNQHSDSKF